VTPTDLLKRALAGTQGRTAPPVTDEFAEAIARRLENRGVVNVPGLTEDEPEDTPADRLTRYRLETKALEAKWAAQRQAEQDATAADYPQTTASIFRAAIAGASAPVPLNGIGVLRAPPGRHGRRNHQRRVEECFSVRLCPSRTVLWRQ
jgi:hypothetical protein